jgi:glycosyltransferase involved in cell wall biosynthesis
MLPDHAVRRRVLVVAYYFPPLGLSGVQRTLKFVKFLPEYGWQPTVLTVEPGGYYAKDDSLLEELEGRGITVVRTRSSDPLRLMARKNIVAIPRESLRWMASSLSQMFLQPDNKIGWKKHALRRASDLFRSGERFDAIFATAPPFTDFLIGQELKRRFRVPLVLDYRDGWVGNPFNFYATPFHRAYARRLEERVLRDADRVVVVHRRLKELLITQYPFLGFEDIQIVPHGFDAEDFSALAPPQTHTKMRFTYSGVFYDERTPRYFLEALAMTFQEHPETRGAIEARFVGLFRKEHLKYIKRLNLGDAVTITGYLPHRDCVREVMDSDVLWMMMTDTISTPGKVFEYIGARKPVLGCVPEGVVKQTLLESNAATITQPKDTRAIADAIYHLFTLWKRNALPVPAESFVQRYDRKLLTWDLVKVLESVAEL